MKKRIYELQDSNRQKSERMSEILETLKKENRSIADDASKNEMTEWSKLNDEIKANQKEIEILERQLEVNQFGEKTKTITIQPEKKERTLKDYNIQRVINAGRSGEIDGFEGEISDELKRNWNSEVKGILVPIAHLRAAFTVGANDYHISDISKPVDIISDKGILSRTGWRTETLANKEKLSFSDGFTASFLTGETDTISEATYSEGTALLTPHRIAGKKPFSRTYLSVSQSTGALYNDMAAAVERALVKRGLDIMAIDAYALTSMSGGSTAVTPSFVKAVQLKGAVNTPELVRPMYYAGNTIYSEMEATSKDSGSGRYIIENGKLAGVDAVNMGGLMGVHDTSKYDVLYADASRVIAAFFAGGAIDVWADPYGDNADAGQIMVYFDALGDVKFNPSAIKVIRNFKIA